ncbi:uncharacterized protein LOC106064751 [Biomphalaria glabrata]|uniref:Uncharacterized protein LOC106064751 n=1 Tax=Biomphalaria glabrata TaxID=6526 RepID=A0A9W2ZLP3_BIOGL|nr:uncharacterized protein LOC106064751 [Biomphalaria glabrata]XP_055875886.1 uncharacterized protein LOC106064751 [Biomphalaria glabrata]
MPRAKQASRSKKRATRNSKSAAEDVSEPMEQSDNCQSADNLNDSQQSQDLNESKASSQLNDTHTSEQLDDSLISDQPAQDSEMVDDLRENVNGKDGNNTEAIETINESSNPDTSDKAGNKSQESENNEKSLQELENAQSKSPEDSSEHRIAKRFAEEPIIPYKPHDFPVVNCSSLIEKWDWHIKIFPVDQADIRRNSLISAAKAAEETWFHLDKKKNEMGVYNLCAKNYTDASEVMLKIMQTPMTYRYITVQLTRREPNKASVDQTKETFVESESCDLQQELDKLPRTEIAETAVLLLDFMYIQSFDNKEGKEKKRSLFVKYLPEGTTKELLNVLFPLANNLDIIKTGNGRSAGDLNVTETNNIIGYCKSYVAINVNGAKNIFLDWKEENSDYDDNMLEAVGECPFEVLPKNNEILYEAVPVMEEDESVQYLKRKRDIEIEQRRSRSRFDQGGRSKQDKGRTKPDLPREKSQGIRPLMEGLSVKREKRSRWDKDVGPAFAVDVLKRQMAMNEKIQSQLALLQSASIGAIPSLLDVPVVPGSRGRKDRKRDRFERERKISESSKQSDNRQSRERNLNKRDRSGERRNSREDRGDHQGRSGRFDTPIRGSHFGGGNRFDDRRGRGGRFPDDPFINRGGHFPGPGRGGHFDSFGRDGPNERGGNFDGPPRGGPFEPPGRMDVPPGRGGHFGRGGGRFDGKGRGGQFEPPGRGGHFDSSGRGGPFEGPRRGGHYDSAGRGGHYDPPGRGGHFDSSGRGGRFDSPGRGGHFDSAGRGGRFDSPGRGGHFDSAGRGGHFDSAGRGGRFDNQARGGGRFDNQSRGGGRFDNQARVGGRFDNQGRGGRFDGQGRGVARGGGPGGFDNRNKGKSFENRPNNNFGQQNTYNQPNLGAGGQDFGNQQGYNYANQQTGYDTQNNYNSTQTGYNAQVPYSQPNAYNQGSYGTQQSTVTNPATDYASQPTAQTSYTNPATQPVTYPSQPAIYSAQQPSYDQTAWAQAYGVQQQASYTGSTATGTESYWGQPADYTNQTTATTTVNQSQDYTQAYTQQATATNQATSYNYNNQNVTGTEYTADPAAAYANQGYYATGQQTAGVTDTTYGAYSTQDTSAYGTAQSTLTTAYNFAQYPSNSS